MQERDYYLGFSLIPGIGPKTFALLLKYFKTAEKAWSSTPNKLKSKGFTDNFIAKFQKSKLNINVLEYKQKLKHKKVSFVAFCDKEYPKLLKQIPNPPIVLFVKGDMNLVDFERLIGIVGTRRITNYGKEVTEIFSSEIAMSDFTVVSGLALGVDAQAAWAAIDVGGKTIAVLGNGVDLCFPQANEKLYDKILDGNGIIISEFPLGVSPTPGSFPSRNRIIAGLSLGVLVTEGAEDSGSLITADYAFKFNRKVFAIPGPITSKLSVAPLKLIEKGAQLVTSVSDIAKELNMKTSSLKLNPKILKGETKEEQKIIDCLENDRLSFDEIVRKTDIPASKLASILTMLEIKGIVKNLGGIYLLS